MKSSAKIFLATALYVAGAFSGRAQQQPVMTVAIEQVNVGGVTATAAPLTFTGGTTFNPPNEAFGPVGTTINVGALATGTFLTGSYTYSFFVNGIGIGTSDIVSPPARAVVQWRPPQPGSYFITVTATDGANTATSLPIRFFASGTVISSPLTNTLVPVGSSVVVKADATVGQGFIKQVQFFDSINGASPVPISGSANPDLVAPYSVILTPSGKSGDVHSITAIATDNNNVVQTASAPVVLRLVTPVGVPPSCFISNPIDQAKILVGAAAIPINVDAHSPNGLINKVELYIDGALFGTLTAYPYSFQWSPSIVGNYKLTALAYDDKNNVVASATNTILIAAPPTVTVTTPTAGATVPGGSPTVLVANASDTNVDSAGNPLTITSVQFFVDGNFVGQASAPSSLNTYSVSATLKQKVDDKGSPQPSIITALATDSGGLSGVSSGVSVNVTNGGSTTPPVIGNPPAVTLTAPANGSGVPVNKGTLLIANAVDSDGNVVSVQFFANGKSIGTSSAYPYSVTWTPTSLGAYAITAKATDNDGNTVTSSALQLSVGNLFPTVRITSPTSGGAVRIGVQTDLAAAAFDADGNIASVQFSVNGTPIGSAITSPTPSGIYKTSWTPTAEGLYRISAVALDDSGAPATSTLVVVFGSAVAADAIFSGTYQGTSATGGIEVGNFAVAAAPGKTATFIAYSTSPSGKTYFYSNVPVDNAGGYQQTTASGTTAVQGAVSQTGTTGTFDGGRLTFIGVDTQYLSSGSGLPSGYFGGSLVGKATSVVAAVVGTDGSVAIYISDGAFNDAAFGRVDATGAYNFTTAKGNRVSGRLDSRSGLLTGNLTGSNASTFSIGPKLLSLPAEMKVAGEAFEVRSDIVYPLPPFNTYDQVVMNGRTATIKADSGQITRVSFLDLSDDIVQVEFSGAGTLAVTLENLSGPMAAGKYNQPGVQYMKGHANMVISGADETTNLSIFSVGKITAVNQDLFSPGIAYDGVADVGSVIILSENGKFGGLRTANASYSAAKAIAGVCAPGVQFTGPLYVGDISAADTATPMLVVGSVAEALITGGSLTQVNGRAVQVSGLAQLRFVDGMRSDGQRLNAQQVHARLQQDGVDVTAQIAVGTIP